MTKAKSTEKPLYVEIPITELHQSKYNVRARHDAAAITEMAASIKKQGIIHAPSVSQTKNGWEVISGWLRVLGAFEAGLSSITGKNVSHYAEVEKIELSMAENITRRDMSSLELYKAFDRLFRAGRSVAHIAAMFDLQEKKVRQKLAIGGLPKLSLIHI